MVLSHRKKNFCYAQFLQVKSFLAQVIGVCFILPVYIKHQCPVCKNWHTLAIWGVGTLGRQARWTTLSSLTLMFCRSPSEPPHPFADPSVMWHWWFGSREWGSFTYCLWGFSHQRRKCDNRVQVVSAWHVYCTSQAWRGLSYKVSCCIM